MKSIKLNHTQVLEERFLPSLLYLGPVDSKEPACIFQTIRRRYTDDE